MLLQTNRLIVGVCAGHRPCPASGRGISPHMTALPPPSERCVGLSAVPASRNVPDFSLYKNRRRIAATCSALTECDIFCTFCARLERSLMFARSARGKPRQPSMSESVQAVWKGWLFAVATIRCPRPTSHAGVAVVLVTVRVVLVVQSTVGVLTLKNSVASLLAGPIRVPPQ